MSLQQSGVDANAIRTWLNLLGHTGGDLHVCSTGDWSGRQFPATDPTPIVDYIQHLDAAGKQGIYLRATTLGRQLEPRERGGAQDSLGFPGLWSDIDIAGPGHKHTPNHPGMGTAFDPHKPLLFPLPGDVDTCLNILREARFPQPTVIIHSGGGIYAWWLLHQPENLHADPMNMTAATTLSEHWQRLIASAASRLDLHYGSGVGDLARVLRVPGTTNRKEGLARPCRILDASGPRYTLDELILAATIAEDAETAWFDQQGMVARQAPPPRPATRIINTAGTGDGVSVLDDFEEHNSWSDILEPAGWTLHHVRGDTTYWTRPGKSRHDGHSASTGHAADRDRMWCFSDAAGLDVGVPMTKGYVWCRLNGYTGTTKEAVSVLATMGYGSGGGGSAMTVLGTGPVDLRYTVAKTPQQPVIETPTPTPISGEMVVAAGEPATTPENTPPTMPPPSWRQVPPQVPKPIHTRIEPRPFPVGCLPPAMADMVSAVAGNRQIDPALPAMLGLAAASALAAPRFQVRRQAGWAEPLVVSTCTALPSGEGKSHTAKDVFAPLYRLQKRQAKDHERLVDEQIDAEDAKRGLPGLTPAAANRIEDRIQGLEASKKAPPRIMAAKDSTAEALASFLARNGGHGAILDPEGTAFGMLSGRYQKGSKPNFELLLNGYDGDLFTVDRIGRGSETIERAILVLGLATQPEVLRDVASDRVLEERGMLARMIVCQPTSMLGLRDEDNALPYNEAALRVWGLALEGIFEQPLVDVEDETGHVPTLCLSPGALAAHKTFCRETESRLAVGGDLRAILGWAAKHKGRALRIAGLLHLIDGGTIREEISERAMLCAISICDWAAEQAMDVFQVAAVDQDEATPEHCQSVVSWIRNKRVEMFTIRELRRGIRAKWATRAATEDALNQLVEDGYLHTVVYQDRSNKARIRYEVNPYLLM